MHLPKFSLVLALGFLSAPQALAQEKKDEVRELSLGECIAIAVERQPSLKAAFASQDSTTIARQALYNIGPVGNLLAPDLKVRKAQADRGLTAAEAEVQKVHAEVVHDVTRLYYSVVYARVQVQHLEDVVAQIEAFADFSKKLLNSTTPGEMTQAKYDTMLLAVSKVRKLRGTAQTGVKKAEAALREAMGVSDGSLKFRVKDRELPVMQQNYPLKSEEVVEMALARRPELIMAQAGADAFRLEACAQDRVRFRRKVPTLAAGSDLHAKLFPTGSRDPGQNYRPEPILPEMPGMVVGRRSERVARVEALSRRADSVQEKARNLIVLEAESTFLEWDEAAKNIAFSKEALTAAKDLMEKIQESFDNPKAQKDQLIRGYGEAAEAIAEYNSAVFQYLLEMAAMERVTAGGIRPEFPGR